MKVVNLFGGPGSGKSTTAAALFSNLKRLDFKCELVTEYAKDVEYEGRSNIFEDQLYITAKQNRRLKRLQDYHISLDYAITDCSLLLGLVYTEDKLLHELIIDLYHKYDNHNFYVTRKKKYQSYGRSQTEKEAIELDKKINFMLRENGIHFHIATDEYDIQKILDENFTK